MPSSHRQSRLTKLQIATGRSDRFGLRDIAQIFRPRPTKFDRTVSFHSETTKKKRSEQQQKLQTHLPFPPATSLKTCSLRSLLNAHTPPRPPPITHSAHTISLHDTLPPSHEPPRSLPYNALPTPSLATPNHDIQLHPHVTAVRRYMASNALQNGRT